MAAPKKSKSNAEYYSRNLIEVSLDPLVTISPDGKITDVNEATVKATGFPREKLIGDDFSNYFTNPEKARQGYKQVLKEGLVKDYPLVIRQKSGKNIPVLYNASVYKDDKGKVLGVFAAARDISELDVIRKRAKVLEGAEELLAAIANALDEVAFASREGLNTEIDISSRAASNWIKSVVDQLPKLTSAYEAALKFREIANERNIIREENFKLEEKEGVLIGTFLSDDCAYRKTCIERKKRGLPYLCFRAIPFITAIKLMTGREYKREIIYEQTVPGKVCVLMGSPTEATFKVGLSYKLGRGTVKIHERDCNKIGIDIIDKVTIKPSRKERAERKMTAMSYSQTKYPQGMVIINIVDAKSLGLMEKDTVYVTKAKGGEVQLVDEKDYESEYDVPGLEEAEKEEPDTEEETVPEKKQADTGEESEKRKLEHKINNIRKKKS